MPKLNSSHQSFQDEWVALYDEGYSFQRIAVQYGVDRSTVSRWVRECRPSRKNGVSSDIINQVGEAYANGHLKSEIARSLQLSPCTVGRLLFRHFGVPLRDKKSKNQALAPLILDRYRQGESILAIADGLEISSSTAFHYLERHGVPRRELSEAGRVYWLDNTYLTLDTCSLSQRTERSFALGLIWARGRLVESGFKTHLNFTFPNALEDLILNWMSAFTEADPQRFKRKKATDASFELRLYCQPWVAELKALGFPTTFPVADALIPEAFWEGYLTGRATYQASLPAIYISFDCETLAHDCRQYLKKTWNIPVSHGCLTGPPSYPTWRLIYRRRIIREQFVEKYAFLTDISSSKKRDNM